VEWRSDDSKLSHSFLLEMVVAVMIPLDFQDLFQKGTRKLPKLINVCLVLMIVVKLSQNKNHFCEFVML
jgi:hypothetical protein